MQCLFVFFFFFNDTATTEIYTLSLHDALPISNAAAPSSRPRAASGRDVQNRSWRGAVAYCQAVFSPGVASEDRKSTRLNSSHVEISYAVFCLKKKKKKQKKPKRP